jgi:nucleotide-binding universal stress UspA family protein
MKILIAYDGSPESEAAVSQAGRRPWPRGSQIRLLTVEVPIESGLLKGSPTAFDRLVRLHRAEALRQLGEAAGRLRRSAPELHVYERMKQGSPKRTIVEEAEKWGADLIMIGSRSFGTFKRFLLGSVSLAVAAGAPCSVEIVRRPR